MSSLLDRIQRLEKRYSPGAYDPAAHVRTFRPSTALIKDALEAAITVGLYPLISDTAVNKLVREIGEQYEQ